MINEMKNCLSGVMRSETMTIFHLNDTSDEEEDVIEVDKKGNGANIHGINEQVQDLIIHPRKNSSRNFDSSQGNKIKIPVQIKSEIIEYSTNQQRKQTYIPEEVQITNNTSEAKRDDDGYQSTLLVWMNKWKIYQKTPILKVKWKVVTILLFQVKIEDSESDESIY